MKLIQTEIDFSTPSYIDNFLPQEEFENIRDLILNQSETESIGYFPRHYVTNYSNEFSDVNPPWNWYATHMLYDFNRSQSSYCEQFYAIFVLKFYDMKIIKSLIRMKINFYPHSETLKVHGFHDDYPFDHCGALFSINTCDGYTEFEDGTKVDSVANRLMLFNPKQPHRSTTTTTAFGRFNINFNFL
jgi:hypothetical protein